MSKNSSRPKGYRVTLFVSVHFIQDMTRDQIAAEKVALQKALLYYESIHGRPVSTEILLKCA